MAALIISNKEMEYVIKIVKCYEESSLLINSIKVAVKNEAKEQKGGFLNMLLGKLGASLLGSMLAGKGVTRGSDGITQAGKGVIKTGQDFSCHSVL